MSEKMREEFEEWAKEKGFKLETCKDRNYYRSASTSSAWHVWQASRQSQVVKLPDWWVSGIDAAMYRDDVLEALDAAGVRYE